MSAERLSVGRWCLGTTGLAICFLLIAAAGVASATTCESEDGTNTPGCYRNFGDTELSRLLQGTATHPFAPPEVCGVVVNTPSLARQVLNGFGCRGFRRELLAAILNIRRSILFGDGRLGSDSVGCFETGSFEIVLRCGDIFVPGPDGGGIENAAVVTEETPLARFVELADELCNRAKCPSDDEKTCSQLLNALRHILDEVNESRDDDSDCQICRGDETPPALSCPTGLLRFECESPKGAPISYSVSVGDNCDPEPSLVCFPPPGTILPVGDRRTVTCVATDVKGNVSQCVFEVEVVDTTSPSISCPQGPIIVDCMVGEQDGAVVNFPAPVVSDVCDPSPAVRCDPPSGSFFPFGTTTVVCTATDATGNTNSCSFEVRVVEETPTAIFCSDDITVECTTPGGVQVDYPLPVFSATCDPPESLVCEPPPGSFFPLGTTPVTCRAVDHDGTPLECSFNVHVVDTQAPTIVCPQNQVVECISAEGTPVLFDLVATDACDSAPIITCEPPSGTVFPLGSTTVRCVARDLSGNVAECEFNILVRDTTPPVITCPQGPIIVACAVQGEPAGAVVNYAGPAVTDNCDASPQIVCDRPSGSVFPLGATIVNCSATDASGNRSECSFEVRVVDEAPPGLVCVESFVRECTGPEGAIVDYPAPVAADECGDDLTITCEPATGSLFPIGSTTVSCIATDPSGNSTACSFTVRVEDTTPPMLQCVADIVVECATTSGTPVDFEVFAVDSCDPQPIVECNPPSGSTFPPGVTTVECSATDRFGNESTCTFDVSVVDTIPPELTCPTEVVVECETPAGAVATYATGAVDRCDGEVPVLCEPPSGSLFPPGVTIVTCSTSDSSGNENRCQFEVRVVDTTPPEITCSRDAVVVECDQAGGGTVTYALPVVSDRCDPDPHVVCDPPSGSVLPLGVNTIVCTATDSSGNQSGCSFDIEVVDRASPALVCVEDIVRECTGPDGAFVEYPLPRATDTCDPAPNLSCLPPSGSLFPIGETIVTCTADDQSGNMIQCEFKVIVVDTSPPRLQCPTDIVADCLSPEGAPVSYAVTTTDVCDPNPTLVCDPPSGHLFPLGATTVTCTATDNAGNEATCTFTVTVVDETPPTVSCPEDFERECVENGTAVVEYPLPSVVDTCDPAPVVVCEPASGTRLPEGRHVITCTAVDASGNEARCEFAVTVVDSTAPELVCPPDLRVECQTPKGAVVEYALPVANDACEGQPEVRCTPPSGSVLPLGMSEVVCMSTDRAGNETQCSFLVNVVDTTAPRLLCPEPIVVECESPAGAQVEFEITATDACDARPTIVCEPPSGSVFPLGQTVVTCVAEDASGNRSECLFSVTVVDETPPEITCPEDVVVVCTVSPDAPRWRPGAPVPSNVCSAVVDYPAPDASDICDNAVQVSCTPPSGTRLELGTHEVTCRARDASGNESTCSFVISVRLPNQPFVRGDANEDGTQNIADPISIVRFLFLGLGTPRCRDALDANDDGALDLSDTLYLLNYNFSGGAPPPEPFLPLCGFDPTGDNIGCERYLPCS